MIDDFLLNFFSSITLLIWFTLLIAGLKFWKVGSRKLYCIEFEKAVKKNKRKSFQYPDDMSDDGMSWSRKYPRFADLAEATAYDHSEKRSKQVLNELKGLRKDVNSVLRLTKSSKLPPGLKLLLMDTFKCPICCSLIKPPVSYSRCCQSIVGCEACIDAWYSGAEGRLKSCPLCRRERAGGKTTRLNGMSDFLEQVIVFEDENDSDDAGPSGIENAPMPPENWVMLLDDSDDDNYDFP